VTTALLEIIFHNLISQKETKHCCNLASLSSPSPMCPADAL
jgi:hypothetical protein